ncbi:MAG: hypothetical protein M1823_005654, partial [Watsoniomyces obsoletus]
MRFFQLSFFLSFIALVCSLPMGPSRSEPLFKRGLGEYVWSKVRGVAGNPIGRQVIHMGAYSLPFMAAEPITTGNYALTCSLWQSAMRSVGEFSGESRMETCMPPKPKA